MVGWDVVEVQIRTVEEVRLFARKSPLGDGLAVELNTTTQP